MNHNQKYENFRKSCEALQQKIFTGYCPEIAGTYVYEDSESWAACKFTIPYWGQSITVRCFDHYELSSPDVDILMDSYSPKLELVDLYIFAVKNWISLGQKITL